MLSERPGVLESSAGNCSEIEGGHSSWVIEALPESGEFLVDEGRVGEVRFLMWVVFLRLLEKM